MLAQKDNLQVLFAVYEQAMSSGCRQLVQCVAGLYVRPHPDLTAVSWLQAVLAEMPPVLAVPDAHPEQFITLKATTVK